MNISPSVTWLDLVLLAALAATVAAVVILTLAGYERRERRRDELKKLPPGERLINGTYRYTEDPKGGE